MLPYYASDQHPRLSWLKTLHPRRHAKYCLAALVFFSVSYPFWLTDVLSPSLPELQDTLGQADTSHDFPPLYEKWYELERNLPQHNETLPYPEGANGEYFYASNHVWGLGFNNALQEQLFLSHLAYISNRTFVFDVYTWNYKTEEPYTDYYGKPIPSRIPLSAFIAGPTVGGFFSENDRTPRSVSKEYFQKVCPQPTLVKSDEVNNALGPAADVNVMMEAWSKKLREMPVKCIEVGQSNQIFDYKVFGDGRRTVPFLDEFIKSPVVTRFAWSSLINTAVADNAHLFTETPTRLQRLFSFMRDPQPAFNATDFTTPILGLLSIHVRRGDFEEHCRKLAGWGSEYMGWLQTPALPDRFHKPALAGLVEPTQQINDVYLKHCWPAVDEIIAKIDEVRQTEEGKALKRVFVMTNGPSDWVAELKKKVMRMGGWDGVSTSRDLTLIPEQKYIAQAVDMAIAMRSQVFIGNGFSSLSANVVMLRLSRRFGPLTNRMW